MITERDAVGPRISIQTVAKRARVSTATVSRVLNHRSSIAKKTRQRVLAVAEELGYETDRRFSRFFSTLRSGTKTVAFSTIPFITSQILAQDGFYSRHLAAVQRELEANHHFLMLAGLGSGEESSALFQCVREGRVDGIIAEEPPSKMLMELSRQVPVVLLNQSAEGMPFSAVIVDMETAARQQIQCLRDQGHCAIACFRIRPGDGEHRYFWTSYEMIGEQLGLEIPNAYLAPIRFRAGEDEIAIREFLDRVLRCEKPPTAILTMDVYAAELVRQLAARGLAVPRDVSVMGFDDFQFGRPCSIPLSTYRQDFETMSKAAVQLLLEQIRNPDQPTRTVQIPGRMIIRASTAAMTVMSDQ